MFDYARKMQLALTDRLRRAGLAAGAGVLLLIGLGFLLAALWVWLADHLGWGALGASLAVGLGFVLPGLALLLMARTERHPAPKPDELRAEIQSQVSRMADTAIDKVAGAADAGLERASERAGRLMGRARQKTRSATDEMTYRADRYADRAEAQARRATGEAADRMRRSNDARPAREPLNAAGIAPLIGAFAFGITLASRLGRRRDRGIADDWEDDFDDQDRDPGP
ncbi:Putative Holin-X, holin superfamily III [Paracoccus halophilus]|uniref:Putative Holin-X, holin superfamily III n=1 Tax=Paracoccus halophilus TaxID=376733 RepID=A0A099F776_9RHOB|nr:phage holin family protein [Paracoccus halophilus]KGJ06093.1 hypothetical protein IT41_02720 [Paracoccus halophilus]SFA46333.1 Putative Holin-X, holin superfamily III [Paracoccus halophilus]